MKELEKASSKNWALILCIINFLFMVGMAVVLSWHLHRSGTTKDVRVNASLSAENFILVDHMGVPAAILGVSEKGDAELKFFGPKGETVLEIGTSSHGKYPGIALSDGKETIAAFSLDEYQLPYLDFFPKGSTHTEADAKTGGMSLNLDAVGLPSLRFYDKRHGHCPLWLFLDDEKDNRPQIYLDKNRYDLTSIVESTLPPMIRKRPVK